MSYLRTYDFKRLKMYGLLAFCILGVLFFQLLFFPNKAEAYGTTGSFSNGELQDLLHDDRQNKNYVVDWKILDTLLKVELSEQGYPDGKGNRTLHYLPYLYPYGNVWAQDIEPVEWTKKSTSSYQQIYYGPRKKFYVGNKPFVIAFREKRGANSANLLDQWMVVINSYTKNADGTYTSNLYPALYSTSDRKTGSGYEHRFHNLDGSSSPNVSGTYDEWITNYITVTPNPNYPLEYIDVYLKRYLSATETWEGWIDNFWMGPADQFDPNMNGNEWDLGSFGSYYNDTKAADPVDAATGNYTYQHTDIQIPGRGLPLEFTRYYSSKNLFDGPLGTGWSHTYHSQLWTNPDQSVTVLYPDGKRVRFNKTANGYQAMAGTFETLHQNADGNYTLTYKSQTRFLYDPDGKLVRITDKNGNSVTLNYNANGQLTTVADPAGRTLTLNYDANGRIGSVTDPISRTISFGYDAAGRLKDVANLRGISTNYTYDDEGLTSITDGNGNIFLKNIYDANSRVIAQYDAKDNKTAFTYDDVSKTTTVQDARGNTTGYKYNDYYRVTEITDPLGQNVAYTYDPDMNRTSVTDQKGYTTSFAYDDRGNILTKQDPAPLNGLTRYTYDSLNNLTRLEDANGNVIEFNYDANGNLLNKNQILSAEEILTTRYTYDDYGQVVSMTDANLNAVSVTYDVYGNPVETVNALGDKITMSYDPAGRKLTEVSPRGNVTGADPLQYTTTFDYDAEGNLTAVTDHLGNQTLYAYDGNNHRISETDALGNQTTYEYDGDNRLIRVTDAQGHATRYEYDPTGNLIKTIDAKGNISRRVYDPLNRQIAEIDPLLHAETMSYDPNGNIATVTDAVYNDVAILGDLITDIYVTHEADSYDYFYVEAYYNNTWNQIYGSSGNAAQWVALSQPASQIRTRLVTNGYTQSGWGGDVPEVKVQSTGKVVYTNNQLKILWQTNNQDTYSPVWTPPEVIQITSGSPAISYEYDAMNRKTKETDRLGRITGFTYDAVGNLLTAANALNQMTAYGYDNAYRLISVTDAQNQTTGYTYDPNGNRTEVINAKGKATTYQYDAVNRVTQETDPLGNSIAYRYDAEGNRIEKTDAAGKVTAYEYDPLNRLIRINYPDLTTVAYSYDPVGNRTSMSDSTGTTTYQFDSLNRLTQVTYPGNKTLSYTYDEAGNKTALTYPDGKSVSYEYDAANRLIRTTDWQSKITETEYNPSGAKSREILPNGIQVDYSYNPLGELAQLISQKNNNVLTQRNYIYNAVGNRINMTNEAGDSTVYGYDELQRLTFVQYPDGISSGYTYDEVGNRLSFLQGNEQIDYTYDFTDRLTVTQSVYIALDQTKTVTGSVYFAYDPNGNMTQKGNVSYQYDSENRLIQVITPTETVTYTYDGDGNRTSKTVNGQTTSYIYDISEGFPQLLVEMDGTGTILKEYINGTSVIGSVYGAGNELYYLYDGLGSVIAVTDAAGTIVAAYDYDAFGALKSETGSAERPEIYRGTVGCGNRINLSQGQIL